MLMSLAAMLRGYMPAVRHGSWLSRSGCGDMHRCCCGRRSTDDVKSDWPVFPIMLALGVTPHQTAGCLTYNQ